jgi:hypothetical protein
MDKCHITTHENVICNNFRTDKMLNAKTENVVKIQPQMSTKMTFLYHRCTHSFQWRENLSIEI